MTPEQALWSEVLYAAVTDAVEGVAQIGSQSATSRINDTERARCYITVPNADFNQVCHMAGLDPIAVRENVTRKIAKAPTPAELAECSRGKVATLTYDGKTLSLAEWSQATGLPLSTLRTRVANDWTPERTVTAPYCVRAMATDKPPAKSAPHQAQKLTHNGQTGTVAQWAVIIGVKVMTINWRLRKGWPVEAVLSPQLTRRGHRHDAQTPGVPSNLPQKSGTGGGTFAQEITDINFSQDCAA